MREMPARNIHAETAQKLGVKYRIWKWGIVFRPNTLTGVRNYSPFRIVPLDGWITDSKEVMEEILKNGGEL